jgi:phosphopantothenoylcysteine decarboxylase/phosphopantothenate--cysteine ligase
MSFSWRGLRVLITSGPTREFLDPVRFLSNSSSGKMGWALASAARRLGAKVTVISGPVSTISPKDVEVKWVTTALEMRRQVLKTAEKADLIISAAAVTDWRAKTVATEKIKKKNGEIEIALVPNPDIIGEVGEIKKKDGAKARKFPALIGFALETRDVESSALKKMWAKNLDMIVANSPASLSSENIRATLLLKNGVKRKLPLLPKRLCAQAILKEAESFL